MGTDIHYKFQKETQEGWVDVDTKYEGYRDYLLFAWLSDVRNEYGPFGLWTLHPVLPLDNARGLPSDLKLSKGEYIGDYCQSWLSADEILESTPPNLEDISVVSVDFYKKWDHLSPIPNTEVMPEDDTMILADSQSEITDKTTHVRFIRKLDSAPILKYFIDEVKRLKDLHGNVRFVFGFDC